MNAFEYKENTLFCENVRVKDIIAEADTPVYIYSKNAIIARFNELKTAFQHDDTLICFSVKSNSNLTICKILAEEGSGFDVVSGGELFRVLKVGGDPSKVVFAGVGKTDNEIQYAIENNIFMFNVESIAELRHINAVAERLKKPTRVALRINPDIDAQTHAKTTTGKKENKFGIDLIIAGHIVQQAKQYKYVDICGLHVHLGSPIYAVDPYVNALEKILDFMQKCRNAGLNIKYMNVGGGYCISYKGEKVIGPQDYAAKILPYIKKMQCRLILEPGRYILGNSGILVSRVIYTKENSHGKKFIVCDAAMNDLLRPSLYDAFHRIWPVDINISLPEPEDARSYSERLGETRSESEARAHQTDISAEAGSKLEIADIVGPVCESSDVLAKDRAIPKVDEGDLLAIYSAGAYGFSMSSSYNSRPRPCEILVDKDRFNLIRKRETYGDLIKGEDVI